MFEIVIGILIGLVTGVIQFFLLYKFVTSVTGGKAGKKTVVFAVTQFMFPFAVLLLCAFLLTDSLMWVGIGAAVALISSAVIKFVLVSKQKDNKPAKKPKQEKLKQKQ